MLETTRTLPQTGAARRACNANADEVPAKRHEDAGAFPAPTCSQFDFGSSHPSDHALAAGMTRPCLALNCDNINFAPTVPNVSVAFGPTANSLSRRIECENATHLCLYPMSPGT